MHLLLSASLDEGTPVEEAYRQIDEAIEKYQVSILALKSRRNHFAPISRIPPEIMSRIFSFAKRQGPSSGYQKRMSWIKLTHVTRHWRDIAIGSPDLWVDLPIGNMPLVEEMLKRSKDAGLAIKCNVGSSRSIPRGLELALKHSARVIDLSLQNVNSRQWTQLQQQLPESAPRLEYLTLQGTAPRRPTHHGKEPLFIPECVLRETGRLRHVELSRCKIDWNSHSHILRALSHLRIHHLSYASRPTAEQFVDVLKGMPDLELLDLQYALPVHAEDLQVSWTSDRIHFASLKTLTIVARKNELEPFFACVIFPPTATVKVACNETSRKSLPSRADFSSFFSRLARSYSECSSVQPFRTIILRKSDMGTGIQIKLYTNALTNDEMLDHSKVNPKFMATLDLLLFSGMAEVAELQVHYSKFILGVFNGVIRLQDIERVYLESGLVSDETIANTFGVLPRVSSVMVGDSISWPFIQAVNKGTDPTIVDRQSSLYFPCLSSIFLHHITFRGTVDDDSQTLSFAKLRLCLIQRCQSGATIEKLILRSCRNFSESEVGLLAEYVGDVEWDGKEIVSEAEVDTYSENSSG